MSFNSLLTALAISLVAIPSTVLADNTVVYLVECSGSKSTDHTYHAMAYYQDWRDPILTGPKTPDNFAKLWWDWGLSEHGDDGSWSAGTPSKPIRGRWTERENTEIELWGLETDKGTFQTELGSRRTCFPPPIPPRDPQAALFEDKERGRCVAVYSCAQERFYARQSNFTVFANDALTLADAVSGTKAMTYLGEAISGNGCSGESFPLFNKHPEQPCSITFDNCNIPQDRKDDIVNYAVQTIGKGIDETKTTKDIPAKCEPESPCFVPPCHLNPICHEARTENTYKYPSSRHIEIRNVGDESIWASVSFKVACRASTGSPECDVCKSIGFTVAGTGAALGQPALAVASAFTGFFCNLMC